jgi:DNA-binding PadR family transcriptional regulator
MAKQTHPMGDRPLSPQVLQILLSLTDKQLHGYAIIRDVKERTEGQVKLTAGTLYSALRRMMDAGLIEESEKRPVPELDDERRRYYAITAVGKRALKAEAERSESFVAMARKKGVLRGRRA